MTPKVLELDLLAAELPDRDAAPPLSAVPRPEGQGRYLVEQPSWGPERQK